MGLIHDQILAFSENAKITDVKSVNPARVRGESRDLLTVQDGDDSYSIAFDGGHSDQWSMELLRKLAAEKHPSLW